MDTLTKLNAESEFFSFDFTQRAQVLAGIPVISATVTLVTVTPAGSAVPVLGAVSVLNNIATLLISGGAPGSTLELRCDATLADGEIDSLGGLLTIGV